MNLQDFYNHVTSLGTTVPIIKPWLKVKWTVIKKVETWILVDCRDWWFTWVILPKEAKELERSGYDLSVWIELEAEVLGADLMDQERYYTISISKLIQYDIWNNIIDKRSKDEVIKVIPTEANLWWLLIDMHWIKWFIPLSQLAPVNYPRVEDWDQEKIFECLLWLVYKEFTVRIINIDEDWKRIIFSEREALREERDEIMENLEIWNEYEWIVSWVSSYWLFVTIWWWIEWLVHISEITYWHVDNIDRFWKVWSTVKVKVIWYENWKISLSLKKLKPDPWTIIPKEVKAWDIITWDVIRFVPYWVFIRVYDDINWLVHLSEVTDRPITNPAEVVKLWQVVSAKVILLDPSKRKIWLSMKAALEKKSDNEQWDNSKKGSTEKTNVTKKRVTKTTKQTTDKEFVKKPVKKVTVKKKSEIDNTQKEEKE